MATKKMFIGIDTSGYGAKIGVVIGLKQDSINYFVRKVEQRLSQEGYRGALHWRRIRTNIRKRILPDLIEYLKDANSRGLVAYIFTCNRPAYTNKALFFLKFYPMKIAE